MADFVPHTDADIAGDARRSSASRALDELFAVVPAAIRLAGGLDLDRGSSEPDVVDRMERARPRRNRRGRGELVCFAGGGAYDHEVPAGRPVRSPSASGVRDLLHALPARGRPGRPAGALRVPDDGRAPVGAADRQRLALRRGRGARRGGQPRRRDDRATRRCWVLGRRPPALARGARHVRRGAPATSIVDVPLVDGRDRLGRGVRRRRRRPALVVVAYPNYLGVPRGSRRGPRRSPTRTGPLLVVVADPVAAGLLRSPGE